MFIKSNNIIVQQAQHICTAPIQHQRHTNALRLLRGSTGPVPVLCWRTKNQHRLSTSYIQQTRRLDLGQSCSSINDAVQTLLQNRPTTRALLYRIIVLMWNRVIIKQCTQDFDLELAQCWTSVIDAGPTSTTKPVKVSMCSLGIYH